MIDLLSYFNPLSNDPEFHSVEDFVYLSVEEKIATIVATIFASMFFLVGGVAMFRYAVFKFSDKYTEKEISGFHNQTTLEETALIGYPKDRLVVVDNYCLLIDDLVKHYLSTNKTENPYTLEPLPVEVVSHPCFSSMYKATEYYQSSISAKIGPETRNQLALLVKGMLNSSEIFQGSGSMPEAQNSYLNFNDYYQSLSNEERTALNEYRISGWRFMLPAYSGMSPTTFGTLYESIDRSCAHSVAGSFIQMLLQLDPETKFDCSECRTMSFIVDTFKSRNR